MSRMTSQTGWPGTYRTAGAGAAIEAVDTTTDYPAWSWLEQERIMIEEVSMAKNDPKRLVTVCDQCLQDSCWHGEFMCDAARTAGTTEKSVEELVNLDREHPSYWEGRS